MSRGRSPLVFILLALAALLVSPAFAADKVAERPDTTADIVQPEDLAARQAPRDPGPGVPGPTGSRGGWPGDTLPIDYDSPADLSEGFDDITLLPGLGWFFQNNSQPLGTLGWFQGNDTVFPAHVGVPTAYIAVNYSSGSSVATISNWMLTPEFSLSSGDTVSFWTRTAAGSTWPDRLQVRMSTNGASTNVGTLPTDVGDFTTLLLDINPTYTVGGYPEVWTQYTVDLSGVPPGATGRIGFRYFVENGGPSGDNSNYIGIDTFEYVAVPLGISLAKTVGTVPGVCAGTDSITVPYGTTVTYCFTVTNDSSVVLNYHDLVDDHLGTILDNFAVALPPGASGFLTVDDVATATVTNVGTWTARDVNPGYVADDTVPFNFIDISATGTPLNLTEDGEGNVTMPFPFTFYGVTSTDVRVGNNGGLLFGVTSGDLLFSNVALPAAAPALAILPFWDDFGDQAGNVYYETQGTAPNRQFIVQWHQRPHYLNTGAATLEVILYEGTNEILFQYLDTDFGSATYNFGASATAGLNLNATTATQYSFNTPVLTANKAILFSLTPVTEVTASDTATVTVTVPDIVVSPASLSSVLPEGGTETLPLDIQNVGTGDLDWTVGEAAAPLAAGMSRGPEAVLHDNGPLVTHPGGGFGGADASALQTALGMTIYGYGQQIASNNRVADDFTVPGPAPWTIDTITFFAYQTGSTTTSTINDVRVQIWDGIPGAAGSNIVFGDLTTNRLASSTFTNDYRVLDTDLLGSTRPIMASVVTIGTTLPPGTYWLDWFCGGTLASGPWAPPVSILGSTGSGNAMQSTAGGAFAPLIDVGPQDFPFVIEGTSSACDTPSDLPWASVSPAAGTTLPGTTDTVDVTFDATGLAVGLYEGLLCVNSNDPDTSLVEVPVSLTVDSMPFLDGFETGNTSRWSLAVP